MAELATVTTHPSFFGHRRALKLPPLTRHELQAADGTALRLHHAQGGTRGTVVLTAGTAMTGLSYCIDTVDENLAEYLVRVGFDVWLADWRTSPELTAHTVPYSLDDVGRYDWPALVEYVCRAAGTERVSILAHCLSSPALMLSLVRGHLDPARVDAIVASQVALHLEADPLGKIKQWTHVSAILNGDEIIHQEPEHVTTHLADVVISGLAPIVPHLPGSESCGNPVCARHLATFGGLLNHARVNPETHALMGALIPEVVVGFLKHVAPVVLRIDLLDEADHAHLDRLAVPITFVSGEHNHMFVAKGTESSFNLLCKANGSALYRREVVAGYGHLDCLIGATAAQDVFPVFAAALGPEVSLARR
jgi:cholesterol oxidase